jgi:hypothetical protein
MEVWPSDLPQKFSASDYNDGLADNMLRSQMDSGPDKVRRLTIANAAPLSGSMMMDLPQWIVLKDFYVNVLHGAGRFEIPNPEDDGATALIVRFTNPPTRSQWLPGVWRVAIMLEVMP